MTILLIFLTGLIAGSVANMLSYRLPLDKPILWDRSRCPLCETPLAWYSLFPLLSFFIQLGKCRSCSARISWRYPLLELAMGLLWVFVYIFFGSTIHCLIGFFFIFFTLVLFVADFETFTLPLSPMIGIGILGGLRLVFGGDVVSQIKGLLLGFLIFYGLKILSKLAYKREAMGSGDVILSSVLCFFLGFHSAAVYIYSSFLLGGSVGVFLLFLTSKKKEDMVPFGPILVLASYLAFFFGEKVWSFLGF